MQIKDKFVTFAKFLACPYVLNLDAVKPYVNEVSIILVGSVATGICNPSSDVDLCIMCPRETYNKIAPCLDRNAGKYMEMSISGVKTRYYMEAIEDIVEGLNKLDDLTFYLYNFAIPLDDVSGAYKNMQKYISDQHLVARRKEHVFRSMLRRRRALSLYLDSYKDPFGRITMAHDLIKAILRAIAVYDNLPYDPKKHPYQTALSGPTGQFLQPCIDELMSYISRISRAEDSIAQKEFIALADNCISAVN